MDIQYLAGIFDGEGWSTVAIQNSSWHGLSLTIGIVSTNKEVIEEIHKNYGGYLYHRINKPINGEKRLDSYSINWRGHDAKKIISQMFPYLIVKRKNCQLWMNAFYFKELYKNYKLSKMKGKNDFHKGFIVPYPNEIWKTIIKIKNKYSLLTKGNKAYLWKSSEYGSRGIPKA